MAVTAAEWTNQLDSINEWTKVIALLPITAVVAVLIHEIGHLLAARLVGMKVHGVGFGSFNTRIVREYRIGSFRIDIGSRPFFSGYADIRTQDPRGYRARLTFAIVAGPFASVALAVGWVSTGVANTFLGAAAAPVFIYYAGCATLDLLAPDVLGDQTTDGKIIRSVWAMSPEKIARATSPVENDRHDLVRAFRHFDFHTAAEVAGRLEEERDGPAHLLPLALQALMRGETEDAISAGRSMLECQKLTASDRAVAKNLVAYALALDGGPDRLEEAQRLAMEAYETLPEPGVAGTVGAVLVQREDPLEGVKLLEEALPHVSTNRERSETLVFLAIGYQALRQPGIALESIAAARTTGVDPDGRVSEMLPAVGAMIAAGMTGSIDPRLRQALRRHPDTAKEALVAWAVDDEKQDWVMFADAGGTAAMTPALAQSMSHSGLAARGEEDRGRTLWSWRSGRRVA